MSPNFSTPRGAVEYLEGRAKEIERVLIPPGPNAAITFRGEPIGQMENVGMVVCLPGMRLLLRVDMAEAVLNDGILNRAGVRIHLFGG
jgi:hypothetical protein